MSDLLQQITVPSSHSRTHRRRKDFTRDAGPRPHDSQVGRSLYSIDVVHSTLDLPQEEEEVVKGEGKEGEGEGKEKVKGEG